MSCCVKRDSIPFISNPFFILAINTISFVFRLRALYSSNHSLWFIPSVCFTPFPLLLQQLIITYLSQIAHYCFTGECILILQHTTPFCQQTNHQSFIAEINSIDYTPSHSDSADSAFFTSFGFFITSLHHLLLLRQLEHLLHLKQQPQSVHRPIVLPAHHEAIQ